MVEPYSQTPASITSTHSYTQPTLGHASDFTNNETYWTILDNSNLAQASDCNGTYNIHLISNCIIFAAAFLGICLTVYGLYSLIKIHRVTPVYVINLFITDLFQTSVKIIQISENLPYLKQRKCNDGIMYMILRLIYMLSVLANVCFMVCISAERYTMIAHPVWDRNHRTMRTSALVSVIVWIAFPGLAIVLYFVLNHYFYVSALGCLLLPLPLLMFFFAGTWRAFSRNRSIPPSEQRRIMCTLALVLCIYVLLYLPTIIYWFHHAIPYLNDMSSWNNLGYASSILLALNPLADFLFYLLLRKDANVTLRPLCFCCLKRQDSRLTATANDTQI